METKERQGGKSMKKYVKWIVVILIVLVIGLGIWLYWMNHGEAGEEFVEYTPAEEITEEQARNTIISVYYKNKETGELMPEARMIDVKLLSDNPYEEILKILMEGPKSEKLEKVIPEGSALLGVELQKDTVCINFSNEFIGNQKEGAEEEAKTIYSIVNTLTELNEVKRVKILINGEEGKAFKDNGMNFKETFERMD